MSAVNIIVSSILFGIGTAGLLGNSFLMASLVAHKHLSEPSSILMFSAATADIGHGLIILCHVAPELALGAIAWGEMIETTVSYANLFFWYASLGSLLSMALNRYFAVCKPLVAKEIFKMRRVLVGLGLMWLFSLGVGLLPIGVCCRKIFDIHYDIADEESHDEATNIVKLMTQVADGVVLVVMSVCYSLVYWGPNSGGPKKMFKKKLTSKTDQIVHNITKQFMVVSIVFSLLSILQVITQYVEKNTLVVSLLQICYTLNASIAPFIYITFSVTVRREMFSLIRCRKAAVSPVGSVRTGALSLAPTRVDKHQQF